jgi:adenosylcobinamide-GDP ribazoletransferase
MLATLRRWRIEFLGAVGFFTRIPVSDEALRSNLNQSAKFFPLVGLIVAGLSALVLWAAMQVFPLRVAIVISMIASVLITGAFHEDGLADSVDGFGGGYDKEAVLRIMQDSRIGTFGGIALVLALGLKLELLASLPEDLLPLFLIAAHMASRFVAITYLATHDYVRFEGKSKPLATRLDTSSLVFAGICGLAPLALLAWLVNWPFNVLIFFSVVGLLMLTRWLLGRYFVRRIGGYTGDCLGFAQQVFELVVLAIMVAWFAV